MSRNTMYAAIGLMLVIIIGAAGAYWGIKKFRQKQNQEYRYEGTLTAAREGVDAKLFKASVLTEEVLSETIAKHDLINKWELPDEDATKAKLKEKFTVKVKGLEVTLGYQDKDKVLAKDILNTLMASFYEQAKAQRSGGAGVGAPKGM